MNDIEYTIKIVNPEFFETIIKNRNDAFMCTALNCRYLGFKVCPRVGDYICYPRFELLPEEIRYWLHDRVVLKVLRVLHNPVKVWSYSDNPADSFKPKSEPDVVIKVFAEMSEYNYP